MSEYESEYGLVCTECGQTVRETHGLIVCECWDMWKSDFGIEKLPKRWKYTEYKIDTSGRDEIPFEGK